MIIIENDWEELFQKLSECKHENTVLDDGDKYFCLDCGARLTDSSIN